MNESPSEAAHAETGTSLAVPRHLILFVGALVALGALSLDTYLPAMPVMAQSFGVSMVELNYTISIYLVGYGLGQFFGGAFSDQVGRKRIGLIGLTVFTAACIAISFAHTVEEVQWLRFFQAIGGGFSTVICMAIVRDVYPISELGRRMATVMLVMLASPVIAPWIGTLLLRFGWQSIFIFKATYASGLGLYYLTSVPETHHGQWRNLSIVTVLKQCGHVITRKVDGRRLPMLFAFAMALGASTFMTFLTNASFAYMTYFGVSKTWFPFYFGIGVIGMIATNTFSMRRLNSSNARRFFRIGLATQLVAVTVLVGVVLMGAPSIWLVVAPVMFVVGSLGLMGPAGSSQYMSHFSQLAGSASSMYTTLLFSLGALFGVISSTLIDGTLRPMAFTMLGTSVAANLIATRIYARR